MYIHYLWSQWWKRVDENIQYLGNMTWKTSKSFSPSCSENYLLLNMTRRQLFRSRYWKKIYNFLFEIEQQKLIWFSVSTRHNKINVSRPMLWISLFFFFFPSSLLDMQQFYLVNLFSTQQTMSESHWGILPDAIYRLNLNSQRALFYPI